MPRTASDRDDGGPGPDDDGIPLRAVLLLLCCAAVGLVVWRWPALTVPIGVGLTAYFVLDHLIAKERRRR